MIGIQEVNDTPEIVKDTGSDFWMQVAKDAYTTSTTWFDANVRSRIEKNVSMFQSKHPQGSKYNTEAYKYRSRVFRPKVRASIRKSAAAGAVAFFPRPMLFPSPQTIIPTNRRPVRRLTKPFSTTGWTSQSHGFAS